MKKLYLLSVFLVFAGLAAGNAQEQEEIDYLLFLPNSGSQFVNESRAMIQLDNLARYLTGRNLVPGQIIVYGYAAAAVNDIEPVNLSRARALFVINELQRRGVPRELFAAPVGYGSVDLWGSNTDEEDRSPNRRVRILVDGSVVTPAVIEAAEPEPEQEPEPEPEVIISSVEEKAVEPEPASKFPWWIFLLLALLALILFLLLRKKKKSPAAPEAKPVPPPAPAPPPVPPPAPAAVPVAAPVAAAAAAPAAYNNVSKNLDDEIRFRAYERFLERNCVHGYMEEDWHGAVADVTARYVPKGYQVSISDNSWWAHKSFRVDG